MIRISSVARNVAVGSPPGTIPDRYTERMLLDRTDMQKRRIRRRSTLGTDIGLDLPPGTVLRHGDLVVAGDRDVIIQQRPEAVCVVRFVPGMAPEAIFLAGHAIGNMHRPVSMRGDSVAFPVQDPSEAETFGKILDRLDPGHLRASTDTMVFVPHRMADVRGHG